MGSDRAAKAKICEIIESMAREIVGWSREIHAHPELGHQEHMASGLLAGVLEAHGFSVERGTAGLPTAFRAVSPPGGRRPAVAFLAEYDALPELGHACGHNIIGAASAAAGIVLSQVWAGPEGSVIVLGTPAEETDGAKVVMLERGVFQDIDAALMIHPGSRNTVSNSSLAIDAVEMTFTGRPAHAAGAPHEGINALDACILTFNGVNALRQHLRDDVRIHGIIVEGGVAPNIIPERAVARFYIRAARRDYLDQVVERVKNCARGGALALGAQVSFRNFEVSNDDIRPNAALAAAFRNNLRTLGLKHIESPGTTFGSTDIGNVSHAVPTIHPTLAIGPETVVAHTPAFAQAAASEDGDRALILGAKALAMTGYDLLADAELLRRVRAEFERG